MARIPNLARYRKRNQDLFVAISEGDLSQPDTTEWISIAGITTTIRNRRAKSVMRSASPRAAGLREFDISHSISSTSTEERAIVVAQVMIAIRCAVILLHSRIPESWFDFLFNVGSSCSRLLCAVDADSNGSSRCETKAATTKKVRTKGKDDRAMVEGGKESSRRSRYDGLHSSQSSSVGIIGGDALQGVSRVW